MHDNHDLVETLLKGSSPEDRDRYLEIIRQANGFELPEDEAGSAETPRLRPSEQTLRRLA